MQIQDASRYLQEAVLEGNEKALFLLDLFSAAKRDGIKIIIDEYGDIDIDSNSAQLSISPRKVEVHDLPLQEDVDETLDFLCEEEPSSIAPEKESAQQESAGESIAKRRSKEWIAQVDHKRSVRKKLEQSTKNILHTIQGDKSKKVNISWSLEAREQLAELMEGQRKSRLPLLIEALKEVNYSRMLIRVLQRETTHEGQLIFYGNLSESDRLECTRTIENGFVTKIHVLGLKGHHTAHIPFVSRK